MKGISFVIDDAGRKQAVMIDLEQWGEEWEDFFDSLVSSLREDEEDVPWDVLKREIDTEVSESS